MKNKRMCNYVISLLLFFGVSVCAQTNQELEEHINAKAEKVPSKKVKDTVRLNNSYGLRLGVDLQNIVTSLTNPRFRGIEFMADYRISHKFYLAGEIGNQEKTIAETSISTTASGSYIKAGLDYNAIENLPGMRNLVFVGFRYGYANFSQRLNNYSIATQDDFFERVTVTDNNLTSSGLSAHWLELIAGLKVELINNLFLGFSVSVQRNIYDQKPDGFDNHYIPGFGTTNDFGEVSAGYRYFIQYYLPLYKRNRKVKQKESEEEKPNE